MLIYVPIFDWSGIDIRFRENYDLAYYTGGVLIFERKGLVKRTLQTP